MGIHSVESNDGVRLHVREFGNMDGPAVLLIHGWSQNLLCWRHQYESSTLAATHRIVTFDLRGHGLSSKPDTQEAYTDGKRWADDVAAVIAALGLEKPVLVGWSYGGLIMCDYVRVHGQSAIGGINFVGGAVALHPEAIASLIGDVFRDNAAGAFASDLTEVIPAMRAFLDGCVASPLPPADAETALVYNVMVPPHVRMHMAISRELHFDDVLEGLTVPTLVTQGRKDGVVLPAMAEHLLAHCPVAEASWYDGAGHMPFFEDPARFNRELAGLVARASGG